MNKDETIQRLIKKNRQLNEMLDDAQNNPRDQYHTMQELYYYRMLYNAMAANAHPELCVKSLWHSDGERCFGGGWFIVVMTLPTGQVTNHYREEHWSLFKIPPVFNPPEYDGHTPAEAAERLHHFLKIQKG